jgi:hypothetical protein
MPSALFNKRLAHCRLCSISFKGRFLFMLVPICRKSVFNTLKLELLEGIREDALCKWILEAMLGRN